MNHLLKVSKSAFQARRLSSVAPTQNELIKPILHDIHKSQNAIFKKHHGWLLPSEYKGETLTTSHLHTRSNCSLFDLTYKPILKITGEDRIDFLERLTPNDIRNLWEEECRICLLLNESGGIVDDAMVIVKGDALLLYTHIERKARVLQLLRDELSRQSKCRASVEFLDDLCSIGIQGSQSFEVLNEISKDGSDAQIGFMSSREIDLREGVRALCCRYSFTGEDGFDLLVPKAKVREVYEDILKHPSVKPAGLNVMNTLRIESGFCTYGKEISEEVTPVEANLQWALGKRRLRELNFSGSAIIDKQLKEGTSRSRVGLLLHDSNLVPSENDQIYSSDESRVIGKITSSTFSPVLQQPIAMGYVHASECQIKNKVKIKVLEKMETAEISKMPFVPLSIYKI